MSTHATPANGETGDLFVDTSAPPLVVLIGFMGSGKSSVARNLARRLGCEHQDLDALIETRCGCSVANFFAQHSEDAFRKVESEVLESTLADLRRDGGVMATGGGIAKSEHNRQSLRAAAQAGALVVYLRARAATLTHRIRRQPGKRPLIDGDGILNGEQTLKRVETLMSEREPQYVACANLVLDTDPLSPRRIVEIIAARVRDKSH